MGQKYDAVCDDLDDLRGLMDGFQDRVERLARVLSARIDAQGERIERLEGGDLPHMAWVPREEHERVHSQRDDLGAIVLDLSRKLTEAHTEIEELRSRPTALAEFERPPELAYARLQDDIQQAHQRIRELTAEREHNAIVWEERRREGQAQVERLVAENGRLRAQVRELTETNQSLAEEIAST